MAPQRGVALITIMLIVTLASVLVVNLLSRHHLAINKTRQLLFTEQARLYASGAEAFGMARLREDFEARQVDGPLVDSLTDLWAEPFEPFAIDGGSVRVEIHDLQARFNLNNLAAPERDADDDAGEQQALQDDQPGSDAAQPDARRAGNGSGTRAGAAPLPDARAYHEPLRYLLDITDLDEDLAGVIRDWVDADGEVSEPFGAEDSDYLLADPPHRVPNAAVADITELLAMRGVEPAHYLRLAPYVTALPELTPVNVNTTSATVLRALGGDAVSETSAISAAEAERNYDRVAAFFEAELPDMLGKDRLFSVYSSYFEIEVEADFQGHSAYLRSTVQRNPEDGSIRVLARSLQRPEQLIMVPRGRP